MNRNHAKDDTMTISRREFLDFLKLGCAAAALPTRFRSAALAYRANSDDIAPMVNDIHSQLNATRGEQSCEAGRD
jgi:hypothetical protein